LRPTGRWQPGPELVAEFKTRRDRIINWVIHTREPLKQSYANWGGTVVDVYQALYATGGHTERHLAQINEVKASAGYPIK
jgi:hypothetical protein